MRYVLFLAGLILVPGSTAVAQKVADSQEVSDSITQLILTMPELQAWRDSVVEAFERREAAADKLRQIYLDRHADVLFYVQPGKSYILQVSWIGAGDVFVHHFLKEWRKQLKDLGFTRLHVYANFGDRTVYAWRGAL